MRDGHKASLLVLTWGGSYSILQAHVCSFIFSLTRTKWAIHLFWCKFRQIKPTLIVFGMSSSTWIRAASSYYTFYFHRIAAGNRDLLSDWLSSFRVFSSFSQVMFIIRSTNVFLLWVLLRLLKYWCLSTPARKCLNWSILHVIVEQFFS